jgi:nicotinamidase-related amidase
MTDRSHAAAALQGKKRKTRAPHTGTAKPRTTKGTVEDLHGNVPDTCAVALLLVDWINDLEFEGGEHLLEHALPAAKRVAALKRRCRAAGIPCIYANDNFGRWRSDFAAVVEHCRGKVRGQATAELLAPTGDDYFVLKPKHSGFYHTTLELLLHKLEARTLIVSGLAGNICVLFTANDAYMRDYKLIVPPDCSASEDPGANDQALRIMHAVLKAELTPSEEIDLPSLLGRKR